MSITLSKERGKMRRVDGIRYTDIKISKKEYIDITHNRCIFQSGPVYIRWLHVVTSHKVESRQGQITFSGQAIYFVGKMDV